MTVNATTGTTTTTATKSPSSTSSDKSAATNSLAADFETFLTLLTTQMKNQDPLNPMELTEFIAQLASFSGVEQQVRSNETLDSILSALSGDSSAGLAAWIGREIQAPASASYEGDPIEIAFDATDGADKTELVVKNDFGSVVAKRTLSADATSATWDGTDDLGNAVANGSYDFTIQSYDGDDVIASQTGKVFTTVSEVRIVDGSPVLVVGDGEQVAVEDVAGIR